MNRYIVNLSITYKTFLFFRKTEDVRSIALGMCKTEALREIRSWVLNSKFPTKKVTSIKVIDIYKVR